MKYYERQLKDHIKLRIPEPVTIALLEDTTGRHGNRVIITVSRLAGGRPVMMARQHPAISGQSTETLGHRFVRDYERLVAS